MGKSQRAKGRAAESRFSLILESRDFVVADCTSGIATADFLAIDGDGTAWAWEVKDRLVWGWQDFYRQAKSQAKGKVRWGLALHIPMTSSWLVLRQGRDAVVWHER